MTRLLAGAAALGLLVAVPSDAAAVKRWTGKTQQGRAVTVVTGDDDVLRFTRVNWITRRCTQSTARFQQMTTFRPPLDSAVPDAFDDAGSFAVADKGGIRSRVTISISGRRDPAADAWNGTLKASVVVRRRGKVIDRCRLRPITWSATPAA